MGGPEVRVYSARDGLPIPYTFILSLFEKGGEIVADDPYKVFII